jgi:hypothetical protein
MTPHRLTNFANDHQDSKSLDKGLSESQSVTVLDAVQNRDSRVPVKKRTSIPGSPVRSLVTILTELLQLLQARKSVRT